MIGSYPFFDGNGPNTNIVVRARDQQKLAAAKQAMAQRGSLLDSIKEQAAALQRQVGTADRERLEQYFTSIRDLEERIKVEGEWIDRPKPKVARPDFGAGSPRDRIAGDGRGSRTARQLHDPALGTRNRQEDGGREDPAGRGQWA